MRAVARLFPAGVSWGRAGLMAMAGLLLGAVIGLLVAVGSVHSDVALMIVIAIVVPIPIVVRLVQGRWDPFEPIHTLVLALWVLFVGRPAAELIYGIKDFVYPNGGGYARPGFSGALAICIIGTLSIYAGYFSVAGRRLAGRLKPLPTDWDINRAVRFVLWLLVVCAMLTGLFALALGGPGALINFFKGRTATDYLVANTTSAYVYLGPQLTLPASLILLFIYSRRRTFGLAVLTGVVMLLAAGVTVPRGDRTYVLAFVMPLLVAYYLARQRRPTGAGVVLALVAAIVSLNVLLATRHVEARVHTSIPEKVVNSVTHPVAQVKDFFTGVDASEFTVLELEYLAVKSGSLPFHPWATVKSVAFGPLPRHFVGEKPKAGLVYVTDNIFPVNVRKASFGPSFLGDLYADYGYATVIAYCLLIGIAMRTLWEYFRANVSNSGIQMLLAASLPLLVIMSRNALPDIVARSIYLTGPIVLCVLYASRSRRSRFGVPLGRRLARAPVASGGS